MIRVRRNDTNAMITANNDIKDANNSYRVIVLAVNRVKSWCLAFVLTYLYCDTPLLDALYLRRSKPNLGLTTLTLQI
jgi:hypothetical protein